MSSFYVSLFDVFDIFVLSIEIRIRFKRKKCFLYKIDFCLLWKLSTSVKVCFHSAIFPLYSLQAFFLPEMNLKIIKLEG